MRPKNQPMPLFDEVIEGVVSVRRYQRVDHAGMWRSLKSVEANSLKGS